MISNSLFNIKTAFVEVLLPLPLPKTFTYTYDSNSVIYPGCRVLVQFGKKRILTGVIREVHNRPPKVYEAKEIIEVLDQEPVINENQLKLLDWVADYYMCHQGEVLNAVLPSGLKLNSESKIQLNPDLNAGIEFPIDPTEQIILDLLARKSEVSFNELPKLTGIKRILPLVQSLILKEKILLFEEVKEKYRPKTIKKVRLSPVFQKKEEIKSLFEKLKNKPAQTDIILKILSLNPGSDPELFQKGLEKSRLKEIISSENSLRSLIKSGILEEFQELTPRFEEPQNENYTQSELSEAQNAAKKEILEKFKTTDTVLLHGLTGSGKTEIYIHLIQEALKGGSQVLYLLPEIALTTQIVSRLKKVFGNKLGIYHSRFSANERVEVYKNLISGKIELIVGVRSSVFLPFDNLGLIIVDEEHETSYKQYDPAPRYHARDTALILARIHSAKTLLGTATPSIETYFQCMAGKWGLIELKERFSNAVLPEITLLNLVKERKRKNMRNEFSETLLNAIGNTLNKKEQVILFQNRRGYAPYLSCEDCAYVFSCKSCDVSLTYHMRIEELKCHYCNHTENVPGSCPACGSTKIKTSGFGTEKLEDDLKLFLPDARLSRMDLDTTRRKNSYQEIITEFETNQTQVLIGTQMVTKGLDFDNVSLVGIFDIDRMMYYPDFRSYERTFQLVTQVSGRAGRKEKPGNVLIQTSFPEHKLFQLIIKNDYQSLYEAEIYERKRFFYPPFSRMMKITVKDIKPERSEVCASKIFSLLSSRLGKERVLGPEVPLINKIRNQYLVNIYIKLEREGVNLHKAKSIVQDTVTKIITDKNYRSSQVTIDVDPV